MELMLIEQNGSLVSFWGISGAHRNMQSVSAVSPLLALTVSPQQA